MFQSASDMEVVKRYNKITSFQSVAVGAIAILLVGGSFSSIRWVRFLSYNLIFSALGYGASTIVSETRVNRAFDALVGEVDANNRKEEEKFQQRLTEADTALKNQMNLTAQADHDKSLLQADIERLQATIQQLNTEHQAAIESVNSQRRIDVETAIVSANQELEKLKAQAAERLNSIEEEYQAKQLESVEEIEGLQAQIAEMPRKYDVAIAQAQADNDSLRDQNEMLTRQLLAYSQPRIFEGATRADWNGNLVLNVLTQAGIQADAQKAVVKNGIDLIFIKPRGTASLADIKKHSELLEQRLNLLEAPEFSVEDGAIKIKVYAEPAVASPSDRIREFDLKQFMVRVLSSGNHVRLNGQRDSGKSSLANNIKELILAHIPDAELRLINPLHYSPKSNWDIDAQWDSYPDSLDGFKDAVETLETRYEQAKIAKDKGLSTPNFRPVFYIVDELDTIVATHKQNVVELMKKILKTGTHFKVFMFAIGQSPMAQELKLYKADFNQSTSIFLGMNIPRAIDETALVSSDKDRLLGELKIRQNRGQKYLALVSHSDGTLALSELPRPGEWATTRNLEPATVQPGSDEPNAPTGDVTSVNPDSTQTRQNLERLLEASSLGSEPNPNPENILKNRALSLNAEGCKVSQIIEDLWGMKPSKSLDYQTKKLLVEGWINEERGR